MMASVGNISILYGITLLLSWWRPFHLQTHPHLRPPMGYGLKGTFSKVTQNTPTFIPIYHVIKLKETGNLERV